MTNGYKRFTLNPRDPLFKEKVAQWISVAAGYSGSSGSRFVTYDEVRGVLSGSAGSSGSGGGASGSPSSRGSTIQKPRAVSLEWLEYARLARVKWTPPGVDDGVLRTELWVSLSASLETAIFVATSDGSDVLYSPEPGATSTFYVRHVGASTNSQFSAAGSLFAPPVAARQGGVAFVLDESSPSFLYSVDSRGASGAVVIVQVDAAQRSEVGWDGSAVIPEDGNAVSVSITKNGQSVATITPTKVQTSLAGPNGEAVFLYHLAGSAVSNPGGEAEYQISASRLFPSNTDNFKVSGSIVFQRA